MNLADDTYNVYSAFPDGARMRYELIGRFAIHNGEFHLLEDHGTFLSHIPEGPITPETVGHIEHVAHSMHMTVLPQSEIDGGDHLDLIPEEDLGPAPEVPNAEAPAVPQTPAAPPEQTVKMPEVAPEAVKPLPIFDYFPPGVDKPRTLEITGTKGFLDGTLMTPDELAHAIDQIQKGIAKLRYKPNMTKSEGSMLPFTIASRGDGDFHIHSIGDKAGLPAEAPSATTYAVKANPEMFVPQFLKYLFQHAHMSGKFKPFTRGTTIQHLTTKDAHKVMMQHIMDLYGKKVQKDEAVMSIQKAEKVFEEIFKAETKHKIELKDLTVPDLGNRKAYVQHLQANPTGIHIHIVGDNLRPIKMIHGHKVHEEALKVMGKVLKDAMGKGGKVFRYGGNQVRAHTPDLESAGTFIRALRNHLDKLPHIGGTHKLSFTVGFAHTPEHADEAVKEAAKAKQDAKYPLGQEKIHVFCNVPGIEGHIPMDEEKSPLV